MKAWIFAALIILIAACVGKTEKIYPSVTPTVPENYSALFSAENYSLGEIELNVSHPMLINNFRWGKMPIKIFLDKTNMRDLDLQDMKKSMDEWKVNTSEKISFSLTENKSEADVFVSWRDDEKEKIKGGALVLGEAGPPAAVWTGLFFIPAKGSVAEMELLTVYRRWSPATYLRPMHELGHVLGLDHPKLNDISIMHNFSYYGQRFTKEIKQTIEELYKTPAEPDLAFENFSLNQTGGLVHYNLTIANRGIISSEKYEVEFSNGSKTFWKQSASPLEPAYTQQLSGYFPVDSEISSMEISINLNQSEIFKENNKVVFRRIS